MRGLTSLIGSTTRSPRNGNPEVWLRHQNQTLLLPKSRNTSDNRVNKIPDRNWNWNGVNALSKIVNHVSSNSSKFCVVRIIRFCSNVTSMWPKYFFNVIQKKKNTSLIKLWRHFGSHYCSWNNCLMFNN